MLMVIDKTEYWMVSVDPAANFADRDEPYFDAHEIPEAMIEAERFAFRAWRATVKAICDKAGVPFKEGESVQD